MRHVKKTTKNNQKTTKKDPKHLFRIRVLFYVFRNINVLTKIAIWPNSK